MRAIIYLENRDEIKEVLNNLDTKTKIIVKDKSKEEPNKAKHNVGRKSVEEVVKDWFDTNEPMEFQIPAVADMIGVSSPTVAKYFPRKKYRYVESRRTWVLK